MSRTTFDSLIQAGYSFPHETKEQPPYAVKATAKQQHTKRMNQLHERAMSTFARVDMVLKKYHAGGRRS